MATILVKLCILYHGYVEFELIFMFWCFSYDMQNLLTNNFQNYCIQYKTYKIPINFDTTDALFDK
jgi:hypothetical protein